MVNDELLTLYYYRDELSDEQLASISSALERDQSLAERYATLCGKLDALQSSNVASAPASVMLRWQAALDQAAAQELKPSAPAKSERLNWFAPLLQWNLSKIAAAVLVLSIGILIGVKLPDTGQSAPPGSAWASNSGQSFARGVSAYLQETEIQLASLEASDTSQRMVLLEDIISRNRLYIRAAENSEATQLARVLRAFEPVLLSLADPQTEDRKFDKAKAQLAFELSAMQTKLAHAASNQTTTL